jgi:hypothetical protein
MCPKVLVEASLVIFKDAQFGRAQAAINLPVKLLDLAEIAGWLSAHTKQSSTDRRTPEPADRIVSGLLDASRAALC